MKHKKQSAFLPWMLEEGRGLMREACFFRNGNWKGENNKNLEEPLTQQRVGKSWYLKVGQHAFSVDRFAGLHGNTVPHHNDLYYSSVGKQIEGACKCSYWLQHLCFVLYINEKD